MSLAVSGLLLLALLSAAARARDFADSRDESGRYSWHGSSNSRSSSSTTSSSSSSSGSSGSNDDDDDASSDTLRRDRFARDQARIELEVQRALLADAQAPALPVRARFASKSYQLQFTTLLDRLPDDDVGLNVANPVFGPAAVLAYVSPPEGLFGPARTRTQAVALDGARSFDNLFREVRQAGFLGEFELRTLVDTQATFDLRSRALLTPCFPVTDEPALTIEVLVLAQNANGQLRQKFLAADKFFDANGEFLDEIVPESLPLSRFNAALGRFEETEDTVVEVNITPCDQFSYFA